MTGVQTCALPILSETLAKKMQEIFRKLNKLEAIEEKIKKLDSME